MSSTRSNAKKTARKPWYVRAFEKDYLARYAHRSEEAAAAEIKFVIPLLKLPRNARVLDLACGAGRHSRALAASGYNVIGIDLSAALLREARSRGMEKKLRGKVRYVLADMRSLPLPAQSVDGAISMFTSFGYFSSERDNARVLKEVARVLKPDAHFMLDYFNLKYTLANLVAESQRSVNGVLSLEKRSFDRRTRRLVKCVETCKSGRRDTLVESVRAYSPRELKILFKKSGLKIEAIFGDLAGAAFEEEMSPRCVVLARKAAR